MPLRKNTPMSTYIKDFEKSKAPQFKGKSKEKRREMAIAAKLQAIGKKRSTMTEGRFVQMDKLVSLIKKAIYEVDESLAYTDLAKAVAQVLREEYGAHNYKPFVIELMKRLMQDDDIAESRTYAGTQSVDDLRNDKSYTKLKSNTRKELEDKLKRGEAITIDESADDFFETTLDDDTFVDVSGPSVSGAMMHLLSEFEERLQSIPEEHRAQALTAIKQLWMDEINDWNPNLVVPHKAPFAESKKKLRENREYDWEGQMAKSQLISLIKNAKSLYDSIDDKTQLQSWVQSKLTKAEDYIEAVRTYLDGESVSTTTPLAINGETSYDDEGAMLRIGDVVKAADGGIYQIAFSYSENKPFLTPFDLKKRKPLNLRSRHYFDAMNETEMTPTKKMIKVMEYTATKGGFVR